MTAALETDALHDPGELYNLLAETRNNVQQKIHDRVQQHGTDAEVLKLGYESAALGFLMKAYSHYNDADQLPEQQDHTGARKIQDAFAAVEQWQAKGGKGRLKLSPVLQRAWDAALNESPVRELTNTLHPVQEHGDLEGKFTRRRALRGVGASLLAVSTASGLAALKILLKPPPPPPPAPLEDVATLQRLTNQEQQLVNAPDAWKTDKIKATTDTYADLAARKQVAVDHISASQELPENPPGTGLTVIALASFIAAGAAFARAVDTIGKGDKKELEQLKPQLLQASAALGEVMMNEDIQRQMAASRDID